MPNQPMAPVMGQKSPLPGKKKGNPFNGVMPIAVMAFAIMAFILLVFLAVE